nr:hypothetical protein [Tanacetum cinerariifolium]
MMIYIKGKEHGRMLLNFVSMDHSFMVLLKWMVSLELRLMKISRIKMIVTSEPRILFFKVFHHMSTLLSIINILLKKFRIELSYSCKARNCHSKNVSANYTMSLIGMTMQQVQVNTKFLNSLPPEWGKFVTDIKLAKNMHTSNYDQLYAYLSQHEAHATEVRLITFSLPTVSASTIPQQPLILKNIYRSPTISQQPQAKFPQLDSCLTVPSFLSGDDPIASLNKAMAFLTNAITSSFPTTNNQLGTSFNPRNQATIQDGRVTIQQVQGRHDCDEAPGAKAVLMANLSSYNSDVISEVPISYTNQDNSILDICVQEMYYSEQLAFDLASDIEIKSIKNKNVNESLTAELERYKERVRIFEERQKGNLNNHEKLIDSQMNDMILNKNAEFSAFQKEIDTLKSTLSKNVKENESLITTIDVLKKQTKEKEDKYIEEEIDLEKQKKYLENNVYKVGQSAQTMHMLTKPQVFYDDTHKQALGCQNPFYLKKAQWIKPTLYDGIVISKKHDVIFVVDSEETLMLAYKSRSKMIAKQNDPFSKEKKVNISPINYSELNELSKHFGKHFVSQKEFSAKQAFWLSISNPISEQLGVPPTPVKIEVPSELPMVSLVNKSFQKLKNYLARFDKVMKERTAASVITEEVIDDYESTRKSYCKEYNRNLTLEAELSKMNELSKTCSRLQNHCISLELKLKQNKDSLQSNKSCSNLNALALNDFFHKNDLKAQLQANESLIRMFRLDLEPISSKLKNNREAHEDYLQKTKEHTDTLRVIPSTSANESQSKNNTRKNRITPAASSNKKNKTVEVHPRDPLFQILHLPLVSSVGRPNRPLYLDSGCSKHMTGHHFQLINFVEKFLGTVRFSNDQIAKIIGYGDYQTGNVTISKFYYVEGLGHNLFSVGQFCDSDLEVAFRKHTCFVRNLKGADILTGSRDTNLLSYLNFATINELAKQGLVQGLPKLKYEKDHLCYACPLGKSKKRTHKPKSEDFIQEKLYLLHMDLCSPMRIESINGMKYVLVIVDDYSQFTWVKFLRSKDETPEFVIKFLKMIQVRLHTTVINICTDNGTEFVNQTLKSYYEDVRISHQTSVVRKLKPKADIGIFIGYARANKAYQIYNRRTRQIMESIHVDFDELIAMASEQSSSGPTLQEMTPGTISSGIVQNPPPSTPYVPPTKND